MRLKKKALHVCAENHFLSSRWLPILSKKEKIITYVVFGKIIPTVMLGNEQMKKHLTIRQENQYGKDDWFINSGFLRCDELF